MATTTNYGWTTPNDTDLVKDGAAAIRTLGSSVDTTTKALNPSTTLGDIEYRSSTANTNTRLGIGTTGQILSVVAGVPAWVANDVGDITEVQAGTGISVASGTGPIPVITNTVATTIDAKGDLIAGTGADTFARLAVGSNNQILVADSSTATGLKWAAPAGGGKVLQVVSGTYATQVVIASTSYADTGLSLSITPTSATSKVLVLITQNAGASRAVADIGYNTQLLRGATSLQEIIDVDLSSLNTQSAVSFSYLDSPATTSSTTYKTQGKCTTTANSASAFYQIGGVLSTITLLEIGA
jgi:hypothetical protein